MKKLTIYNPLFINPFSVYMLMWIIALVLYPFSKSQLNVSIEPKGLIIILISVIIAFLLSHAINKKIKNRSFVIGCSRPSRLFLVFLILLYVADFAKSGFIPLFNRGYKDFGIQTIHVFIVALSCFYYIYRFVILYVKRLLINAFPCLLVLLYFLLVFNRGIILFLLFCSFVTVLSTIKLSRKSFIELGLLGVLVIWLFGVLGNIRSGASWYDSSYFLAVSRIKAKNNLLAPFYWGYEYLICSYRNFLYNVRFTPAYDFGTLLYNMIPDFISKRILPNANTDILLIDESLTTGTAYSSVYRGFGIVGVIILVFEYFFITYMICSLKYYNKTMIFVCLPVMTFIMGLTIFDNLIVYSGYILTLFMGVIAGLTRIKIFKKGKEIKNERYYSSRRKWNKTLSINTCNK